MQDVFEEKECIEAWARVDVTLSRTRLIETYDACKEAYCDRLSEMDACSSTWPDDDKGLTEMWTALLLAIVELDHGSSVPEDESFP